MKISKFLNIIMGFVAVFLLVGVTPVQASLSTSFTFNGKGNWSLDGCGSNSSSPVCSISAEVPTGSTIVKAFLYSTTNLDSSVPTVSFDGTTIAGGDWTALGVTSAATLQAFRADVTTQVASTIGAGSAAPFSFSINTESPNSNIDGEVLAIIYSNPAEVERTIAFQDGFSATGGDMTSINLTDPLSSADLANPTFEAILSLGIGFGAQGDGPGMNSIVDINGVSLTTCAGGEDDGILADGGLITIGGLGDSTANDHNCSLSGPRKDDELYTLLPFLGVGDTQILIDTENPSNDDNIFFAGLNITAEATVTTDPDPTPVPEPGLIAMLGLGLTRRKKGNAV